MLKQSGFLEFVQNMVVTGQIASDDQIELIETFDENELNDELQKCSHIFELQRIDYIDSQSINI